MVNYTKSIIYKLCCKNPEIKQIYIGSTANEIRKRKNQHKSDCYNKNRESYNLYVYQFIRDNGGFQNWSMIIIENYPCENKRKLEQRERYFIELLNATLNSINSYTTEEEKTKRRAFVFPHPYPSTLSTTLVSCILSPLCVTACTLLPSPVFPVYQHALLSTDPHLSPLCLSVSHT